MVPSGALFLELHLGPFFPLADKQSFIYFRCHSPFAYSAFQWKHETSFALCSHVSFAIQQFLFKLLVW